jgi:hypothetical protein
MLNTQILAKLHITSRRQIQIQLPVKQPIRMSSVHSKRDPPGKLTNFQEHQHTIGCQNFDAAKAAHEFRPDFKRDPTGKLTNFQEHQHTIGCQNLDAVKGAHEFRPDSKRDPPGKLTNFKNTNIPSGARI